MLSLLPIGIFVALLILQVESNPARVVMAGIVIGLWVVFGFVGATVSSVVFSVGIMIASKMPRLTKW